MTCADPELQMGTRIMGMRLAAIGVLLLCAMAMQTHAATITVTNRNDSGPRLIASGARHRE